MSTAAVPPMEDPRARAARTKRDRTRRALLDAADSAFGSRGWARTRVEDIAQSAGVSAATAYNHFPTKHALLAQVYAPIINPLLVQARQDIAAGRPATGALPDPGDDADPRTLVPMTQALELLIGYGQAAGELRAYPSARDLSGLLVNTVLIRNVNRPGESADITAELLLTVMFGTLRPEELAGAERPFPAAR